MSWAIIGSSVATLGGGYLSSLGKDSDSGGGEFKTKQMNRWSPQQMDIFNKLMGMTKGGLKQGPERYPGQMVAPQTGEEKGALDFYRNLPEERQRYLGVMEKILSGKMFGPEATKQAISSAAPSWDLAMERGIDEQKAYYGGMPGFHRLQPRTDRVMGDISARRGEFESGAWLNYDKMNRLASTQMAPIAMQEMGQYGNMMGKGAMFSRMLAQQGLQEDLMRWQSGEEVNGVRNKANNPWLQMAFKSLNLDPYNTMGAYQQGGGGGGFLSSLLGSAGPQITKYGLDKLLPMILG